MPAYFTGSGVMTCSGNSSAALWQTAAKGITGLTGGLGYISEKSIEDAQRKFGENPAFKQVVVPSSRASKLTLFAIEQAFASAGWRSLEDTDGLILATTTGQTPLWDKALADYVRGNLSRDEFVKAFAHQPIGDLLHSVCHAIGFRGRRLLVTSACSASTQALAIASMWLSEGRVKRCLVGGTEVLCDLTVNGFRSLQLLSPTEAKPFDAKRSGINLSEGSAFLCLEQNQTSKTIAQLSGFGISSDGYHMTAPHPEGHGCYEAMSFALKKAKLNSDDIDWVHAHGTGSIHNDLAEGNALKTLFGAKQPFTSSTKRIHGHALGASGAIETVLCIEAIRNNLILKTAGLETPDAALGLNLPLKNVNQPIHHILKNTLGFGGTNAAVVISAIGAGAS